MHMQHTDVTPLHCFQQSNFPVQLSNFLSAKEVIHAFTVSTNEVLVRVQGTSRPF